MTMLQLLSADRIFLNLRVRDKPQLLQELARRAAQVLQLPQKAIMAGLDERERLGSTGLGKGFALPHVRLTGLPEAAAILVRLARPIAFDAIDGKPVDVVCLLVLPEEKRQEHVTSLAAIARRMRDPATLPLIRKASDAAALYEVLGAA